MIDFPLNPCERECYDVLTRATGPMIGDAIYAQVIKRRRYHRDTVGRALARLVRDGLVHNDHNGDGYSTRSLVVLRPQNATDAA